MRLALWIAVALLAGCQPQNRGELRSYKVTVTRPDGIVHKEFSIKSIDTPWMQVYDGGVIRVAYRHPGTCGYYVTNPAPAGWMMDVEPLIEKAE